jgi:hypothetical protein
MQQDGTARRVTEARFRGGRRAAPPGKTGSTSDLLGNVAIV